MINYSTDDTISIAVLHPPHTAHWEKPVMQNQHSISVASEIRRKLPANLTSQATSLNIILTGEQTEEIKPGVLTVKAKGQIEVRGQAANIHMKSKIVAAIRENSGGRQVSDLMTTKRADPTKARTRGFF